MEAARNIGQVEPMAPYSYQHLLLVTWKASCKAAHENHKCILSEQGSRLLRQCLAKDDDRIGLERYAVGLIGMDRSRRRSLHAKMVLKLTKEGEGYFSDALGRASEDRSRPLRYFARTLAQAHASNLS